MLPLLLLLAVQVLGCRTAVNKPHILMIMIDDQGYGDVGFSYKRCRLSTDFIDRFAQEGLILDRFYTSWMCTPSRASLMTGKNAMALGIQHDIFTQNTEQCLDEDEMLLPRVLRENGYATHLVGKWHLGYARWSCMPCLRGFDTSYGYVSGKIDWLSHDYLAYHDFYSCAYSETEGLVFDTLANTTGEYSMELFKARAHQIIEDHDPDTPLFLELSLQAVHDSWWAPAEFYSSYCIDDTDEDCVMQAMTNAIIYVMNSTIEALKERGMWDDTLMVYFSDNGGTSDGYNSNLPLRGNKGELYDGGVHTAAFLYSENRDILVRRGRTACYVHIVDWFNTLVNISGGWEEFSNNSGQAPPDSLDSIDQTSYLLMGETDECPRREIMLHIDPVLRVAGYIKEDLKILFGDQSQGMKSKTCDDTIYFPLDDGCVDWDYVELYNITADISETTDLSDQFPEVVAAMKGAIVLYAAEQQPLQCMCPTVDGSYPNSDVPFYLPFDFSDGFITTPLNGTWVPSAYWL